jgi:hypothetical protein
MFGINAFEDLFAFAGDADGVDAYLAAGAAAEERTVMDECDGESLLFSGETGSTAGNAATYDDKVKRFRCFGDGRGIQQGIAPGAHGLEVIGRLEGGILSEEECVAASVKAGHILQCDFAGRCANLDVAALLPGPCRNCSEDSLDRFIVKEDLETAWSFPVAWLPVFSAHPQRVGASRGEGDRGLCIGYRLAHAMREQIG